MTTVRKKQQYEALVMQYYGRPAPAKKQVKAATHRRVTSFSVTTRSFDNGAPVQPKPVTGEYIEFTEYDIVSRSKSAAAVPTESFVEYDIAGNDSPLAQQVQQQSMGEAYIEPFEAPAAAPATAAPRREKEHHCRCGEHHEEPRPSAVAEDRPAPVAGGSGGAASPAPAPAAAARAESLTDDDFMSDIKSILSGQKLFDPNTRQLTDAGRADTSAYRKNNTPPPEEDIAAFKENEHAIFDKLAQSMRYANAYDLGAISLDKKFDDFDMIDELSKQKSKPVAVPARTPAAAPPMPEESASHADFIEDLDQMRPRPAASTAASVPPEPENIPVTEAETLPTA